MNNHDPHPFLPSSRSYLTLSSPPFLPPSILSTPLPTSLSMPAFQSHPIGNHQPHHQHLPFSSIEPIHSTRVPSAAYHDQQEEGEGEEGDSLLLHTASVLALAALEEKGYSWLAARRSSTSLSLSSPTTPTVSGGEYFRPKDFDPHLPSHRSFATSMSMSMTPRVARSRHHSRRASTGKSAPATPYPEADFVQCETLLRRKPGHDLQNDRYKKASAIAAEREVRRLLTARVGGWLEWAIGWMDFRDEDEVDEDEDDQDDQNPQRINHIDDSDEVTAPSMNLLKTDEAHDLEILPALSLPVPTPGMRHQTGTGTGTETGSWTGDHDIWWSDAKWLFGVARRVAW